MIKPDGVQRGLVGEIISRFEKKGVQAGRHEGDAGFRGALGEALC